MNAALRTPPTTDPAQILRYRDRQYAAGLLATAIAHFDFFICLNSNPDSSTEAIHILLLSNVLHDWDSPEFRALLKRSAQTRSPGEQLLMNITQGKCYAPHKYGQILSEQDFEVGPYQDTLADRGFMTAVKK